MKLNFANLMEQLAIRFGPCEALVNIERGRRYDFAELHRLTNRIAHMLRERLALRRGDVFLCILDNDSLSLLHTWTALKGEAAAAWTNLRDSLDEHLWQVDFIKPKVVFLENHLLDAYFGPLRERGVTVVCMDPVAEPREGLHYFWDLVEGLPDGNPGVESDTTRDILIYRFTGGTTGRSKCAEYTMDNWLASRDSFYAEFEQLYAPDTRYLHLAPISHGSGLLILPTLFRGGCAVTQNIPDLSIWCRNVEAERITNSLMLPTMIYRLLDLPAAAEHDLSTLRAIGYGGSPMSPAKLRQAQDRFGNIFSQGYGATECLQIVTNLTQADHLTATDKQLGSAGRVGGHLELRVVDDNGQDVPPGETGEIWLRSRATISGYFGNPEQTAAEFAEGFWHSGDLGYIDEEGFLYLVDRKKDMIISGGFNIYAVEVEAAVNAHPAVEASAVVGIPHEEWGEAVHAEVVLRAGADISADALIGHCKENLGRFKVPKTIAFVAALPLSSAGKILRREVRDRYWAGKGRRIS
ncbi:MAG: AMP-binding protein [Sphingopyxis sp.]|nr:AMP-binding protein [Sphingopyxis sp.]